MVNSWLIHLVTCLKINILCVTSFDKIAFNIGGYPFADMIDSLHKNGVFGEEDNSWNFTFGVFGEEPLETIVGTFFCTFHSCTIAYCSLSLDNKVYIEI